MVLFLTAVLGVSALGLVVLLTVKRWELTTGRVLFSEVRPVAGRFLGLGLAFVERRAPALLKQFAWSAYRRLRTALNILVAWTVLRVEHLLERVLQLLRHTTHPQAGGEASAFLREVAQHKKSLIQRSGKKPNAIYEE